MNAHAPVVIGNDPWAYWWRLGYRTLLPIAPPDAPLSPTAKTKLNPKKLGKVPGQRLSDGWAGVPDWPTLYATERQIEAWRDQGAGIAIRCEGGLVGIDADTLDEKLSNLIASEVAKRLGKIPQRIGQFPKRMFFCKTDAEYRHGKIFFDGGELDIRTSGQFVVHGIHPDTRKPYEWVDGPPPALSEIPYFSPSEIDALCAALELALPRAKAKNATGAWTPKDPEELRGSVESVERALRLLPNDYVDRDTYINVLTGVKGALPDDLEAAWEMAWAWCSRWRGPNGEENEEDVVRRDFDSLKPQALGIGFLEDMANKRSGNALIPVTWNEPVPPTPAPPHPPWSQPATVFAGKPVPPQRWLAGEMVPARTVTLLYGDGGTGKSLVSLQLAFGVAASGKWLGMDVTRGAALFVTAEDEPEEVHRRIVAVTQGSGLTLEDLPDLHWRSLSGQDAVLAAPNEKSLMKETPLFAALRAEIMRLKPTLLVLDTLADLFGGDEIKRIHARQFIQLLQGLIVDLPWDMSIILLAHPSVAGMNSGTGTSGSTAWSNSVRSRLYLERRFGERGSKEKYEIDPDIRVLSTKKANRTKQGGELTLRWVAGRFIEQATVAPTRNAEADAAAEAVFLHALDSFGAERPVSPSINAPNYAPKAFQADSRGSEVGRKDLEAAMSRLLSQGVIAIETTGAPTRRRSRIVRASKTDLFG